MGWIGVDLDGTLAHYDGWKGIDHIGEPIPAMVERVKRWLADGHDVKIMTARVSVGNALGRAIDEAVKAEQAIRKWCVEHIGQELPVTSTKDFGMIELWDDRCVAVEANTGRPLNASTRGIY